MPSRPDKKSAVYDYFTVSEDGEFYICQCDSETETKQVGKQAESEKKLCEAKFSVRASTSGDANAKTPKTSNLKRHLERYHKKIYDIVDTKDDEKVSSAKANKGRKKEHLNMPTMKSFFQSSKVTVSMTAEKFKKSIIEMVVKNSIPISFFSTPPFLAMNGEMASKLHVSLDRTNIRRLVIKHAKQKKDEMRQVLKGRHVFLKMDGCTRQRVNYFAINVRYSDGEKM